MPDTEAPDLPEVDALAPWRCYDLDGVKVDICPLEYIEGEDLPFVYDDHESSRVQPFHQLFMIYRSKVPRPARIKSIEDWKAPLPHVYSSAGSLLEDTVHSPLGQHALAAFTPESLLHKRSVSTQVLRIELEGVLGWLDQAFHPLGDWALYVQTILPRQNEANKASESAASPLSSWTEQRIAIRKCGDAFASNDTAMFRRSMWVFSTKEFRAPATSPDALHVQCEVARALGDMLGVLTGKNAEDYNAWGTALPDDDWMNIVDELAAQADHVAVMVVDALTLGDGRHCARVGQTGRHGRCAGDVYRFDESKFPDRTLFTDETAPLAWSSYWHANFSMRNLEVASRFAARYCAHERFAESYTSGMRHARAMYSLFVEVENVQPVDQQAWALMAGIDRNTCQKKQAALSESIRYDHFAFWDTNAMVPAACAMACYAHSLFTTMQDHRYEFDLEALADVQRRKGMDEENELVRQEVLANLDQAERMLDSVLLDQAERMLDSVLKSAAIDAKVRGITLARAEIHQPHGSTDRLIRKIKHMKVWVKDEMDEYTRTVNNAVRSWTKRCAKEKSLREEERRRVVRRVALAAIGNVLRAARERDSQAEAAALERDAQAEAAAAAAAAAAQLAHRCALERTVKLNKAAAARRAATLAARAALERAAATHDRKKPREPDDKKARGARASSSHAEKVWEGALQREAQAAATAKSRAAARERRCARRCARRALARTLMLVVDHDRAAREVLEGAEEQCARIVAEASQEAQAWATRIARTAEAERFNAESARVAEASANAALAGDCTALEAAFRTWHTAAFHAKVTKAALATAFTTWCTAAILTKVAEAVKSKQAAQERCNAIFRQHTEKQKRSRARAPNSSGAPPPQLTPPPPPRNAALWDPHKQWLREHNEALARGLQETQQQWNVASGWATGRHTWGLAAGQFVSERQQHDAQCAISYANFKHEERVQRAHHKEAKEAMAREWQAGVKRFDAKMADLERERLRVRELDDKIAQLERKCVEMRDCATAREWQLHECAAATEAERATISGEMCARLRSRTGAGMAFAGECVLCLDQPSTHIAKSCLHVIGCASCCSALTICPICRVPTEFAEMIFP